MTVVIRPFRSADARAAAEVLRAGAPYHVVTPELLAWQATSAPGAERHALLVAECTGELPGIARTGLPHESAEPGLGFANVTVIPAAAGRGAGAALLAAAEERPSDWACCRRTRRRPTIRRRSASPSGVATGAVARPCSSAWSWPPRRCPDRRCRPG